MNKNYSCLSVSARAIQSCQNDFCSPVSSCHCFTLLQNVLHALWRKDRILPNGRMWRGAERAGFHSPKQTSKAALNWKSCPYLTVSWEQSSLLNGKTDTKSFTLRKTSTLIQEQDHFSFMFPNWSFPQLTPYIASGFPSTFF